jgi:hypothetical protein
MIVEFKSGLRLSIQGSPWHYAEAASDDEVYESVEIGFPSSRVEILIPWAENVHDPLNTIYKFVPNYIVRQLIKEEGGIEWTTGYPVFIKDIDRALFMD